MNNKVVGVDDGTDNDCEYDDYNTDDDIPLNSLRNDHPSRLNDSVPNPVVRSDSATVKDKLQNLI